MFCFSDNLLNSEPNILPKRTDEQSALNKILQETATYEFIYKNYVRRFAYYYFFRNVIDVAALDSHNLQQHEYVERSKLYRLRVHQLCTANKISPQKQYCLLQDVPAPEWILSSDPIIHDDINLVFPNLIHDLKSKD